MGNFFPVGAILATAFWLGLMVTPAVADEKLDREKIAHVLIDRFLMADQIAIKVESLKALSQLKVRFSGAHEILEKSLDQITDPGLYTATIEAILSTTIDGSFLSAALASWNDLALPSETKARLFESFLIDNAVAELLFNCATVNLTLTSADLAIVNPDNLDEMSRRNQCLEGLGLLPSPTAIHYLYLALQQYPFTLGTDAARVLKMVLAYSIAQGKSEWAESVNQILLSELKKTRASGDSSTVLRFNLAIALAVPRNIAVLTELSTLASAEKDPTVKILLRQALEIIRLEKYPDRF